MKPIETSVWRMFTTPWSPDARVERMRTMRLEQLAALVGTRQGVFARVNGSPF